MSRSLTIFTTVNRKWQIIMEVVKIAFLKNQTGHRSNKKTGEQKNTGNIPDFGTRSII